MYLEKILGTCTKVRLLDVLVTNPERRFVENELAREAGAAVSETNRQMQDLVETGVARLERVGRSKVYSLNAAHFLVPALKSVFRDLNDIYAKAAKAISRHAVSSSKNLEAVILIGSVAKRRVRSTLSNDASDVDLVFIVKDAGEKSELFDGLIGFVNSKIMPVYGVNCYPVVLTRGEYLEGLKSKDRFILNVQAEGVELHGRKPRRFG